MKKIQLTGLLVLVACTATKIMKPTEAQLPTMQQKVPDITLARAEQGYTVYKEKCSACHRLHAPSERTPAQWDTILAKMLPKAKVHEDSTKNLITDYLHALSK